jgi:CHAT domain-containing protein
LAIQRNLRPDEALIEYVMGEDNLTVFVLTSDGLHATDAAVSRENLHSRLELLRNLLEQRDQDLWRVPALSLTETLIQPALNAGWLEGVDHVYLVPHGMLNYLPFAVLPLDIEGQQRPIIERFTLAYLPAASSLAREEGVSGDQQTLLAMAPQVSRLKHTSEEAFKNSAGDYQILHLATHGYFNKLNPLLSGLQLEADKDNDGLLEVHEILELKLDAKLVTLSACKTGLGSGYFSAVPAGDDFVGMARAFLQVGSAAVLATLWEVEDRSTVELMKSFYGHLLDDTTGRDKASALAGAQRALLASDEYEHPYYWAPFVVFGALGQTHEAEG